MNKGIVHLIDDIFWNCGFKTETTGEQVTLDYCNYWNYWALLSYCDCSQLLMLLSLLYIIGIIVPIDIIDVIVLIDVIFLLYDFARSALIGVFLIIFGPINVQLRNGLMIWEMSSVLQCARDGWLTLQRPMLQTLLSMQLQLDRVNWSCPTMSDGCEVLGLPAWFSH